VVGDKRASEPPPVGSRNTPREPESIPAAEQREYFDDLSKPLAPAIAASRRATSLAELDRTARMLRLYRVVRDEDLRADMRREILAKAQELVRFATRDDWVGSDGAPARTALVQWLNARCGEWTPHERRAVVDLLFVHDTLGWLRPDFDAMSFARPVVQSFARFAGRRRDDSGDEQYVEDRVVCPYTDDRGSLSRPGRCRSVLYGDSLESPDGRRKLADLVSEMQSDPFTQAAVLNALEAEGTSAALDLVESLANDERASSAALRALGDFAGWRRTSPPQDGRPAPDAGLVIARVPRWWGAWPRLRGPLLYTMTQLGRAQEGHFAWGELAQQLGAPVTAEEYAAFLDQGPRALWSADLVARFLGRGWARAPVAIPRFERWLDDFAPDDHSGPDRNGLAETIADSFCVSGSIADVKALQAFLRKRLGAHPGEKEDFGRILESSADRYCAADSAAARAARPAGSGSPPVLFGN
jgi:hypothetical protein